MTTERRLGLRALSLAAVLASCTDEGRVSTPEQLVETEDALSAVQHVFVIAMENTDAASIYGNTASAPYINGTLMPSYARATNFNDELPLSIPSEPHYVWMEAGTNAFSDHTFTGDSAPSSTNSTASTAHLVTQMKTAGVSWMSYQEGINATTGACPIASSGFYQPKHDPFIFFKDVAGNPPSKSNAYCAAHHKDLSALAADLSSGNVAQYVFITPNQCHDMHGQSGCPNSNAIKAGDDWLKANLPALISYVNSHNGVIFVTWDEGASTKKMAFLALGPGVKKGYAGGVSYTHSSLVKSIERIFGLTTLSTVASANELGDLFQPGMYP